MAMFPLRVVVESVPPDDCLRCGCDGAVLVDSYAIVNGLTPLSQLVDTVLGALGLGHLSAASKGLIQLNNWKALPFDQITDDLELTVDALLKDISNHMTLKVLTKQADSMAADCVYEMKERLLKAVLNWNPQILATIKNAQLKEFVAQLLTGDVSTALSPDLIQGFSHWLEELSGARSNGAVNGLPSLFALAAAADNSHASSFAKFHPSAELPKMDKWFKDNANPTRAKMQQYCECLNASSYRRHHSKISYQQMCNWFSNTRAARRNRRSANDAPHATPIRNTSFDLNELLRRQMEKSEAVDADVAMPDAAPPAVVSGNGDVAWAGKQEAAGSDDASEASGDELRSVASSADPPPPPPPTVDAAMLPVDDQLAVSGAPVAALSTHAASVEASPSPSASRSRLMFDPLTELPLLERYFEQNPHPSWVQIDSYTDQLNSMPYRHTYPPISTHNVKIWFKNRRAKCKRLQTTSK